MAPISKNPTTTTAKNTNKNQKGTNWGPRQGNMPDKPNSLRTNMSKKFPDNIRGIG